MEMNKEFGPYLIIAVIVLSFLFIVLVGVVLPMVLRRMMSKKDSGK